MKIVLKLFVSVSTVFFFPLLVAQNISFFYDPLDRCYVPIIDLNEHDFRIIGEWPDEHVYISNPLLYNSVQTRKRLARAFDEFRTNVVIPRMQKAQAFYNYVMQEGPVIVCQSPCSDTPSDSNQELSDVNDKPGDSPDSYQEEQEEIVEADDVPVLTLQCAWGACNQQFCDNAQFCQHVKDKHFNIVVKNKHTGLFVCQWRECDKTYKRKETLKVHVRTHTGEKPFVCQKCLLAFSVQSHLKEHLERHENPYYFCPCECGASFKTKAAITSHVQKVHPKEWGELSGNNVK